MGLVPTINSHAPFLRAARQRFDSHTSTENMESGDFLTIEESSLQMRIQRADLPEKVLRKKKMLGRMVNVSGQALKKWISTEKAHDEEDRETKAEPSTPAPLDSSEREKLVTSFK